MRRTPEAHPASYWAATAGAPPDLAAADADVETDVVIVGGGFTGLSTAYHLNQQGRKCVLLEANDIGWGASGRNGGIAVPRYKHTFPAIEARFAGQGYGKFKSGVAEAVVECLKPVQQRYREIRDDEAGLRRVLKDGAERASAHADRTLKRVHDVLGFIPE
ncbi:MAG: FAD-dependent oxidoreductase [Hydrocarboniphaga effusa]|nr:FAD-dependent oxidoreductase [Hydrocarboniphaga effusa]